MIIEDEVVPRKVLSRVFERDGHQVICALSAVEVARTCPDFKPHIAIVDWILEGEDTGKTVVEMLHANSCDTRVIICSGLPVEMIAAQLGGKKVARIVTKPVELNEIRALITTCCKDHPDLIGVAPSDSP